MKSYNHNRNCDFSDSIVSYLYGENNAAEKSNFETHLAKCAACADELAAFSEVQFAVKDWRVTEFDRLATPLIVIPYHESSVQRGFVQAVEPVAISGWRQMFNFGFAWKSAMAMAMLVVLGFVILLISKSDTPVQNVAVATPVIENSVNSAPTVAPTVMQREAIAAVSPKVRKFDAPQVSAPAKSQVKPLLAARQPTVKSVGTYEAAVKLPKNSGIKRIAAETVADNSSKTLKSPRLMTDDEERSDDSLRLSELFDETAEVN